MSETPVLLKVDEAAELLRVSPATVRRMIVDGRVRAVSLGEPGSSVHTRGPSWFAHLGS